MSAFEKRLNRLDQMVGAGAADGLRLRTPDDVPLDGRTLRFDGRTVLNFGLCGYLGLEFDPRLQAGVCEAVQRYGTQFSSSRIYVQAPPYVELEHCLGEMFGGHALVVPSTTLGHAAVVVEVISHSDVGQLEAALAQLGSRERLVVAAGFAKSFAAGGAAIVFPDAEWPGNSLLTLNIPRSICPGGNSGCAMITKGLFLAKDPHRISARILRDHGLGLLRRWPRAGMPQPEPSWPTVIATTVRLWLHRRPVAGLKVTIQDLAVRPGDSAGPHSVRRSGSSDGDQHIVGGGRDAGGA
jgi:hypothetical protein